MASIYGVQFDEVNDYFNITDDAALDIVRSNGDQGYAIWLGANDNAGALFQYFLSAGNVSTTNSLNAYFIEESFATNPNIIRVTPQASTGQIVDSSAFTFPLGKTLVVIYYNSSNTKLEMIVCPDGGTATRYTAVQNLSTDVSPSVWNLGRRADANADRYFGGIIYNFLKFDGTITDANVETLAADMLAYDRTLIDTIVTSKVYFPMNEGTGSDITDDVLGLTGTGSGFTGSQWVLAGTTGGTSIPVIMNQLRNQGIS